MSADNAWFVYQDGSGLYRIKHGFASHIPEMSAADLEEFFADAPGYEHEHQAIDRAWDNVMEEQVCEYGVWVLPKVFGEPL